MYSASVWDWELGIIEVKSVFLPTQHISKNAKLKVNVFSVSIVFLLLLVNDLLPVSIWGLRKITILQCTMVWKWHPECESALFSPYYCLIQEHHIIMHAQKPVPHTCANHAHAQDLPLLFLLSANSRLKKAATLITAHYVVIRKNVTALMVPKDWEERKVWGMKTKSYLSCWLSIQHPGLISAE